MFDDHLYNLLNQLTQEHKSLWRIKNMYKEDAQDCKDCQKFWEKLEEQKEKQVSELEDLLKDHLENRE